MAIRWILSSHRPLINRLRKARLRGYISREFVLHICQNSASSITHLDLGLLELPIGDTLLKERKRNVADHADPEYEAEMPSADFIAPSGLSWLPSDLPSSFKSLTHFVLCKPTEPFEKDIDDVAVVLLDQLRLNPRTHNVMYHSEPLASKITCSKCQS